MMPFNIEHIQTLSVIPKMSFIAVFFFKLLIKIHTLHWVVPLIFFFFFSNL